MTFKTHQWGEAVRSLKPPREPVNNIPLQAEYAVLSIQSYIVQYIQFLSHLPYK